MKFIRGDSQPFKFKITKQDGSNVDEKDIKTLILTCRKYNLKSSPVVFDKNKEDFISKEELIERLKEIEEG